MRASPPLRGRWHTTGVSVVRASGMEPLSFGSTVEPHGRRYRCPCCSSARMGTNLPVTSERTSKSPDMSSGSSSDRGGGDGSTSPLALPLEAPPPRSPGAPRAPWPSGLPLAVVLAAGEAAARGLKGLTGEPRGEIALENPRSSTSGKSASRWASEAAQSPSIAPSVKRATSGENQ